MPEKRVYLKGTYELFIEPAKKGEPGAMPLDWYLALPKASEPNYNLTSPYGDEFSLPIPEGSIKAYVEKHKEKFDFPDPHIRVGANYHRAPGEKTPLTPGAKVMKKLPGQE